MNILLVPIIVGVFVTGFGIVFKSWWSKPKEFEEGKKKTIRLLRFGNIAGILALAGLIYLITDDIKSKLLIKSQKTEYENKIADIMKSCDFKMKDQENYFEKEKTVLENSFLNQQKAIIQEKNQSKSTNVSKTINGPAISSTGQSGGFTGIANFKDQPRQMNEMIGNSIKQNIPINAEIDITALLGDAEAFNFATQIHSWMKSNGYSKFVGGGVSQAAFNKPVTGQNVIKNNDSSFQILIGSKQ
jgi:hypothetical protein